MEVRLRGAHKITVYNAAIIMCGDYYMQRLLPQAAYFRLTVIRKTYQKTQI